MDTVKYILLVRTVNPILYAPGFSVSLKAWAKSTSTSLAGLLTTKPKFAGKSFDQYGHIDFGREQLACFDFSKLHDILAWPKSIR